MRHLVHSAFGRQRRENGSSGGRKAEPELDRLNSIFKTFNDQLGTLFTDADRVAKRSRDDAAPLVISAPSFGSG